MTLLKHNLPLDIPLYQYSWISRGIRDIDCPHEQIETAIFLNMLNVDDENKTCVCKNCSLSYKIKLIEKKPIKKSKRIGLNLTQVYRIGRGISYQFGGRCDPLMSQTRYVSGKRRPIKAIVPEEYTAMLSWNRAQNVCKELGANLPSFNSMDEVFRFIEEIETKNRYQMNKVECGKKCILHEYDPVAVYIGLQDDQRVSV